MEEYGFFFLFIFYKKTLTYRTVPATARVPEYGAKTLQVNDKASSNIEAAYKQTNNNKKKRQLISKHKQTETFFIQI